MTVLENHEWKDEDIEKVLADGHPDNLELVLSEKNEGAVIISKGDVVALANWFNLSVYASESRL